METADVFQSEDGLRIRAKALTAEDDSPVRTELLRFYGPDANIDGIIASLKREAEHDLCSPDYLFILRPPGWKTEP